MWSDEAARLELVAGLFGANGRVGFDSAARAIEAASTIRQAKDVLDLISSASVFARKQRLGSGVDTAAHKAEVHALRKLGQLLGARARP